MTGATEPGDREQFDVQNGYNGGEWKVGMFLRVWQHGFTFQIRHEFVKSLDKMSSQQS
jgi:hypothetical protein